MSKKFFVVGLFLLFLTGCGSQNISVNLPDDSRLISDSKIKDSDSLNDNTSRMDIESFTLTTGPQDAVFRIGVDWVGGMGNYPIFAGGTNRPQEVDGLTVYFDDKSAGKIIEENLPSCVVGEPVVKISANISLELNKDINYSIPPDEDGNQPEESYYIARPNEIYDIEVEAEECEF